MESIKKKKNLPKTVKDLSKEQLLEILKKKRECNRRALSVVEALSELNINEPWMLNNLEHINQDHYNDIVEERYISNYCGYPLCSSILVKVPKQQYKISLTNKTVYDITDRKKFCSNHCFKSSEFLKSQLLTSPLWFRENETIPEFKLMSKKVEEIRNKPSPESSRDFNETVEKEKIVNEDEVSCSKEEENYAAASRVNFKIFQSTATESSDLEENNEKLDLVAKVEKAFKEWFTISTYIYLFGEEKLKAEIEGNENMVKSILQANATLTAKPSNFEEISKLFSILNLDGGEEKEEMKLKPLPDYSIIREEAKNLNIKVRAFYTGQLETQTPQNTDSTASENLPGELPLVDSHAQTALRRRVLIDQLNRTVPDMCVSLEASGLINITDIRLLVRTFCLSAYNVTFKPREWFLIAAIIVKILSFKSKELAKSLLNEESKKRMILLLMSYNLSPDYLDNLMEWLTDVERLTKLLQAEK